MIGDDMTLLDGLLAVGLLTVAALALFLPRRSTAVVLFLAFGVLMAVAWALLGAPDIALAEAAIGAGVTSALLIDAVAVHRGHRTERNPRTSRALSVVGTLLGGVAAGALTFVLLGLGARSAPSGGPGGGPGDQATDRVWESGVDHPVTAVLLNFRSYDTLLEVAVLLVAALAVLTFRGNETFPAAPTLPPVPSLLDLLVRTLVPVLLLVVGWLLVSGSVQPGGAFQAGAVLTGALLLLRLSGWPGAIPAGRWLRPGLAAGLTAFLALAYATALLGDGWLSLPADWAGALIVALETLLTLSIGLTLAVIFVANQEPTHTSPRPQRTSALSARTRRRT